MGFNHNISSVLNAASTILGHQIQADSLNGILSGIHARFLKQDSRNNYSNRVDYAKAIFAYERNKLKTELAQGKAAVSSTNFNNLIQNPLIHNHAKDFFEYLF